MEKKRFSIHDLREFYQSALESANIHENLLSPLMAHKVAGIAQNYSSHDCEELMEKFETALPYLIPKSNSVLESELKETETKYQAQQKKIDEQDKKIEELEDHFEAKLAETMRNAIDFINQAQKQVRKDEQYTRDGYDR